MHVKDCMSLDPWTIDKDRSIKDAKEAMMIHRVRRLPVVDGDTLVGIVTREDILAASPSIVDFHTAEEMRERLEGTTVAGIMAEDPYTVDANDPIEKAAEIMFTKKIGGLPVTEGTKLVGIVTETDVFRMFVRMLGIEEGSQRIDLDCESAEEGIKKVQQKIAEEGLCLSSVVMHLHADQRGKIILRTRKKKA